MYIVRNYFTLHYYYYYYYYYHYCYIMQVSQMKTLKKID